MKLIFIFSISAFLLGCATTYQEYTLIDEMSFSKGGYRDEMLDDGNYKIKFYSNSWTSKQKIEKYLRYRGAELTIKNNYKYFEILSEDNDGSLAPIVNGATVRYDGWRYIIIKMFNEKPEMENINIYNAKRFMTMNKDIK